MSSLLCLAALLVLSHAPLITHQKQQENPILTLCYDEAGNYTSSSQFSSNLWSTLLPSVTSNAPLNLSAYSFSSVGRGPDRVFGFAQCMSAATAQDCRVCLNQSLAAIARLCPSHKQAVVLYDDCILRYSDQSFLSRPETFYVSFYSVIVPTEPDVFCRQLGGLMRNLSRESAQSPSRFAAGSTDYNCKSTIYGMAQCTMDLPVIDCLYCLDLLIAAILNSTGERKSSPSCNIRYDIYAFYPAFGLPPPPSQPYPPAPSPPPPPEAPSSNSGGSNSKIMRRNIIIGVTLAAVSVLVIVIVCIWCASKIKRARLFIEDDDQRISASIESAQPLLSNLNDIEEDSDSFSKANKLTGQVYKGKSSDRPEIPAELKNK